MALRVVNMSGSFSECIADTSCSVFVINSQPDHAKQYDARHGHCCVHECGWPVIISMLPNKDAR
jgi:hypothetical protein